LEITVCSSCVPNVSLMCTGEKLPPIDSAVGKNAGGGKGAKGAGKDMRERERERERFIDNQ